MRSTIREIYDTTLTLEHGDGSLSMHAVGVDTLITLNGQSARLSDLRVGDRATVSCDSESRVVAVR